MDALHRQAAEPLVVVVAAIKNQRRTRREAHGFGHFHIGLLAIRDHCVVRQQPFMIEEQVQLHRSLGGVEPGPGKHLHAQINHAAVQSEKLAGKLQRIALRAGKLLAQMVDQRKKQILINLPTAVFIGMGERGVTGCLGHAPMHQFAFAGLQPLANLTQAVRLPQLAEQHRYKLIPTGKNPGVPHPAIPGDGCIEKPAWRQAQKLAENAGYLRNGRSPSGVEMCLAGTSLACQQAPLRLNL